jgi:serine/threonine protein kinase
MTTDHAEPLADFRPRAAAALAGPTSLPPRLLTALRDLIDTPPPPDPVAPPEAVGPYRVVRERGRGGMGVVYEADDPTLGRRVAVKVLSAGVFASAEARERFAR